MNIIINKNEETGEVNFVTLLFDTGKKIMLDHKEAKELQDKIEAVKLQDLTHPKEFFLTGAYAMGVQLGDKKFLLVTQIEEDTFANGLECNDRVEKEYGL